MYESMLLRKIFALKEEKIGDWRKLHNKELSDLDFPTRFYLADQTEEDEMGKTCGTCMGEVKYIQSLGYEN